MNDRDVASPPPRFCNYREEVFFLFREVPLSACILMKKCPYIVMPPPSPFQVSGASHSPGDCPWGTAGYVWERTGLRWDLQEDLSWVFF